MVSRTGLFVAPLPGTPPVGTAPTDGRLVLGALFGTSFGVLSGAGVVQSASVMTFTVGQTVWALPDVTNTSCVFASPTDSVVLTGTAGPGTGSRIDSIAVKQNNYENADADSRANVILVTGTASGTPVAPTLAAGYSRYANITVPTSAATAAACTVTILATTAVLALQAKPNTLKVADLAALAALSTTGFGIGDQAVSQIGVIPFMWSGTAWVQSNPSTFATSTARDTEYAKASAAYRIAGAQSRVTTEPWIRQYSSAGSWKPWGAGLFSMIPTSVTGTGVTSGPDGAVAGAATTTASINGVFTSDFENYSVKISCDSTTTSTNPYIVFRANGNDIVAGYMSSDAQTSSGAAPTPAYNSAASSIQFARSNSTGGFGSTMEIQSPNLPQFTKLQSTGTDTISSSLVGGTLTTTAVVDGFSITMGGTTTGNFRIRVYGYNNN